MRNLFAVLGLAAIAGATWAGPFGLIRRGGGNYQGGGNQGGFPTAAAAASYMASILRMGHYGNTSGFPYEGVGMSTTADGALRSCCFYGRRPLADSAVFQGSNGMFYACCRYH